MRTLKNHQILFDAECPMCRVYTKAFVSSGLLEAEGRAAYQDITEESCPMLDRQRAANEIALVNNETGEVTYGIESLFKVFAMAIPVLKPLFVFRPFIWIMSKVYAFIAFNRRVIVPASIQMEKGKVQPDFRLGYRLAYLGFTWILTAFILSAYAKLLGDLLPAGGPSREYLICGGQIIFQAFVVLLIDRKKIWTYLGNMMTISLGGALLLLPALLLSSFLSISALFYAGWFLAVAGLMLLEHIRRSRLLGLGWPLTISWVLYRLLVLLSILFIF